MPKIIAYYPLHYGTEYFETSLKSIDPVVDKIMVYYSERPSFGYQCDDKCPDTEEELRAIADKFPKVQWVKVNPVYEHHHRDFIYNDAALHDIILPCDSDEIIKTEDIEPACQKAYDGKSRFYGINGFLHFWRSFNYVCTDGFRPIRVINARREGGQEELNMTIYHFSLAQKKEIMNYKYKIHGHHSEIREDYLNKVFYAWTPQNQIKDLHPTSFGVWPEAHPFDRNTLPDILKQHPNFNKELI